MSKTKRLLLCVGLVIVLAAGVVFVVPVSRCWVLGTLRGEPFQDGYPLGYWIEQVDTGTLQRKMQAVEALAKIDKDAVPAVPGLARLMVDQKLKMVDTSRGEEHAKQQYKRAEECQALAAQVLIKLGPEARAAIPILIEKIRGHDDKDLYAVLVAIGPEAMRAVIEQSLSAETRREPGRFLLMLLHIGPPALPSVIDALQDKDHYIRYVAIDTVRQGAEKRNDLPGFGPEVKQAVPNLLKLINDPVHQIQTPDDKDKKTLVWWMAVDALSRIDPKAKEPLPLYVDWLLEGKPVVEGQPLRALKECDGLAGRLAESWQWLDNMEGTQPTQQIEFGNALRMGLLFSKDQLIQELAAETQDRLSFRKLALPGQPTPPVTTPWKQNSWNNEMRVGLDHQRPANRWAIAAALVHSATYYRREPAEELLLADLRRCVPILADGVQNGRRSIQRWRCAESLRMLVVANEGRQQQLEVWRRELEKELKSIVPGLRVAMKGADVGVRDTVEIVLRQIDPDAEKKVGEQN